MKSFLRSLRDFAVSLNLTIVLLVFGIVLVFAATLDQVNLGIWAVQEKYFRSFVIYTQVGRFALPIFPGGYLIGGLLLVNLVAAHLYRFAFTWRKAGIQLTHFGLIVLLVGELLSGLWQRESHMRITEGETKNYAESSRLNELVFIDTTDAAFNDVVAVPEKRLERKATLQHPKLPFRVETKSYYPNSQLMVRTEGAAPAATAGFGERIAVAPQPVTHRPDERNQPSAVVELFGTEGSIGTFLVSTQLVADQTFTHAGRTWTIALRPARTYQPFTLTLVKFTHDRYAGTNIPKNFSSRLKLQTPDGRDDREVLVYMNNPLRYAGLTFYQAGFENDDRTTVLQVVRNPSWALPYIACALMSVGLLAQFCLHLASFVRRRRAAATPPVPQAQVSAAFAVMQPLRTKRPLKARATS